MTSFREEFDISYYPDTTGHSEHQRQRCRLDLRCPQKTGFPSMVWFHGGGFTGEEKSFPHLPEAELGVVAAGYRLTPEAGADDILADAAAAVAWTLQNIADYGGDPRKVFVAGYSAGGYLAAMIGMNPRWLEDLGCSPAQLRGIIALSAHMATHFTFKELHKTQEGLFRPHIDEYAPLYYVAKDCLPVCLITGDRTLDIPCRVEENELMAASLRALGHSHVEIYEMKGLDHQTIQLGGPILIPGFITKCLALFC